MGFIEHKHEDRSWYEVLVGRPGDLPLFVATGAACCMVVFFGGRKLFKHPDVYISPSSREALFKDNMQYESEMYAENNHLYKRLINGAVGWNPFCTGSPKDNPPSATWTSR